MSEERLDRIENQLTQVRKTRRINQRLMRLEQQNDEI
jgi:hypothetical protein